MKTILVSAACLMLASQAMAQSRPSTLRMACRSAAGLVTQRGAIVLSTGRDLYDRYVSGEGYCPAGLYARPAFVPTADNPQCYIGFYCTSAPPMFDR
jgi:hypothetical protein